MKLEVQEQLGGFTCVMYNQARETSVSLVRNKMPKKIVGEDETLSSKSRVDFACLLPCQDSLIPHIQQVNYRVPVKAEMYLLLTMSLHAHDGCLWSAGCARPQKLMLRVRKMEYAHERYGAT